MEAKDRSIMAQTAYKVAAWYHSAEVSTGEGPSLERLHNLAREIANGMKELGAPRPGDEVRGVRTADSPASGGGGGGASAPSSRPSCPRCNEYMDPNKNWTGLGKYEDHSAAESIRWRCSQRGQYIKDEKRWTGCEGVKWEDIEANLPRKQKSA